MDMKRDDRLLIRARCGRWRRPLSSRPWTRRIRVGPLRPVNRVHCVLHPAQCIPQLGLNRRAAHSPICATACPGCSIRTGRLPARSRSCIDDLQALVRVVWCRKARAGCGGRGPNPTSRREKTPLRARLRRTQRNAGYPLRSAASTAACLRTSLPWSESYLSKHSGRWTTVHARARMK